MISLALLLLQATQAPQRAVPVPGVISTDQRISPAGVQSVFTGRVSGVRFGAAPDELWVAVPGAVYRIGWGENRVLARIPFNGGAGIYGLSPDPVTGRMLISTVGRLPAGVARAPGIPASATAVVQLSVIRGDSLQRLAALGTDVAGAPAVAKRANASGHRVAVLPLPANDKLQIIDADNGALLTTLSLGVVPIAAVVSDDGATAWVTEMGGKWPSKGDKSALQCCDPRAEAVRIDARGIAQAGTVSRVNVITGVGEKAVTVGRHPTAIAWDEMRGRLYVADGNDDAVSVIDTHDDRLLGTIKVAPFRERLAGLAPTALALSPDAQVLYVALGGANAVAVYGMAAAPALAVFRGLIPTSWYPSSLDVSADGRYLAVGSLFGPGSGSGSTSGLTGRYVHAVRGAVNVIEVPDGSQLAAYTAAVAQNDRLTLNGTADIAAAPRPTAPPRAVPERPGEPSLIQHVVYVIKENRTYDQVLGDLARGDGDPSLVQYGRAVTPNQHALAEQFVILDRFFASGGNSADGHQWLTQANETEYTLWPLYTGRSYPYDGSDPLAYSSGGFIWDAAASKGKSVAVFGEFAPEVRDSGAAARTRALDQYRARAESGRLDLPLPAYHSTSPIPTLDRVLVRDYPTWTLGVPDVVRAEIFLRHLAEWEKSGEMPNLVIVQLPSNHTSGTGAGWGTPKALVADNDLALGKIVEGITFSKFWPSTAILVVEDDAQNGVDHVDGHRTVALAISPYTRRGSVDSTFYNHPSMLKTIELMLGLPALSMFDLVSPGMGNAFIGPTEQASVAKYVSMVPDQSIYEQNPKVTGLTGAQRAGALASARMRFDIPDAAPADKLNAILWHDAKGWNTPMPAIRQTLFFPMSLDIADDDRDDDAPKGKPKPIPHH